MAVYSVSAFHWFFWGYSLAFGSGSKFIGNLDNFGLMGVLQAPNLTVPAIVFAIFQSMFASLTVSRRRPFMFRCDRH